MGRLPTLCTGPDYLGKPLLGIKRGTFKIQNAGLLEDFLPPLRQKVRPNAQKTAAAVKTRFLAQNLLNRGKKS
jgi:hypothetical protein